MYAKLEKSKLCFSSDFFYLVKHRYTADQAKLRQKCVFGIAYSGFHLVGRSVCIFFKLNINYYLHMDGNGKKKISDILDLEKK